MKKISVLLILALVGFNSCSEEPASTGTPPTAPQLASPTDGAIDLSTSLTVKWNASEGAATYTMQVSTSNSFDTLAYDSTGLTGTSVQVTGFRLSTKYYWRVKAANSYGTSEWSGAWTFTTAGTFPSVPVLVSPTNGATGLSNSPTLRWQQSTGALSYTLQVSTGSAFDRFVFNDSTLTTISRQLSGLVNGTTYYWRVKAKNQYGVSGWSETWLFTSFQKEYFLTGIIRYKQTGIPVIVAADGVFIQLDNAAPLSVSGGGECNYSFSNVSAGAHRIRITSPSTLPLDTTVTVDHDAYCGTATSRYDFVVTIGLTNQGRELVLPQGIGTTWEFSYLSSFVSPPNNLIQRTFGTHTWTLMSVDVQTSKTQLQISDIRDDSTFTGPYSGGTGSTVEALDTVSFLITISQDSITFNCPEIGADFKTIPRFCLQTSDTVKFVSPAPASAFARYANHMGVIEYFMSSGGNSVRSQTFGLSGFIPR